MLLCNAARAFALSLTDRRAGVEPTNGCERQFCVIDPNIFILPREKIVSHKPHDDWFAFRSCQRVVTEKGVEKLIFAGRKLLHQGRRLQHAPDIVETNVLALISGHLTIVRKWCQHGHTRHSCRKTSFAAKLYFTFKISPSRHTRISSRNDSHLAAFPFEVGNVSALARASFRCHTPSPVGASSDAAVGPATINYAQSSSQP